MIFIRDIINICNGKLVSNNTDLNMKCINFCTDTRNILNGDIYVGIKGETFNGNNFYKEAIKAGASLCILDDDTIIDEEYKNNNIILVNNTITCLQELAKYKRSLYDIPVVAVTGSVGKTSVKDIIYSVMRMKYNVLCTQGNYNNHIGVPLTILKLNNHDALIVEMGMNHFGELDVLSNIAKPTIAVITNIGTAHIGNLGSRENILKAKLEVLNGMDNGTLIINNDNDMLRTVKYDNLITIGIDNDSDYMAYDITYNVFSSNFKIQDTSIELPIGSNAFIYNALFAYAVGIKLGISTEDIKIALSKLTLTPHRLELIKRNFVTIIDDTYNASLDSVVNAASLLSKINSRRVFIFADILELDEYGESIHSEVGQTMIDNKIDVFVAVGNLAKFSYNVVSNYGNECYYFENNDELIKNISNIIKENDTVLLKGSHGMRLIDVVNYLKDYYK